MSNDPNIIRKILAENPDISNEDLFAEVKKRKEAYAAIPDRGSFGKTIVDALLNPYETATKIAGAAVQGYNSTDALNETANIITGKTDREAVKKYVEAQKEVANLPISPAMGNMYEDLLLFEKAGETKNMSAWKAIKNNPNAVPEIIASSFGSLVGTFFESEEAAAATIAGAGAAAGTAALIGQAGPQAAIPEELITVPTAAISGAMGALSGVMETGFIFSELVEEKLGDKEFNEENIFNLLNDEQVYNEIRNKAISGGATVGGVDFMTGILTGGLGGKIARKFGKLPSIATGMAIESTGGAAGEFAKQKVVGQDISPIDILLEGISEVAMGAPNIIGGATIKQDSYSINGGKVGITQLQDFLNTATDEQIAAADIKVKNNTAVSDQIKERQETVSLKSRIDARVSNKSDVDALVLLEKERNKYSNTNTRSGKQRLKRIEGNIDKILSKYEDAEINIDILAEQEAVVRAEGQRKVAATVRFAEAVGGKLGADVNVFDTTKDFETEAKNQNIDLTDVEKTIGGFYDPDSNKIFINKEAAAEYSQVNVGSHEVLHKILFSTIGNKTKQSDIVSQFKTQLKPEQRSKMNQLLKDRDYTETDSAVEYLTVFSDALRDGDIKFEENVFDKLGNIIASILRPLGFSNINFESGKGVYNFLKEYNKSIEKGELTKTAEKAIAKAPSIKAGEAGIVKSKSDVASLLRKYDNKHREMIGQTLLPKDQNFSDYRTSTFGKEIMPIVETITKRLFDKIPNQATKIIDENRGVARKEYQNALITEAATIVSNEFNPQALGENQTIDNFISNRLNLRANDLAKRLGVEETIKESLDVFTEEGGPKIQIESSYTDASTLVEIRKSEEARVNKLINLVELLGPENAEAYYGLVAGAINEMPASKLSKLTFANLKDLAPNITAEFFGISEKKAITAAANLSKGEIPGIHKIIYDNRLKLISILPDGAILEGAPATEKLIGTGLGLPRKLLDAFYEKQPRLSKGAGLDPFKLKSNITQKDFLNTFGINLDGTSQVFGGKDPRAQSMLALIRLTGQIMTNTAVRLVGDFNAEQTADIKAGASKLQFSNPVKNQIDSDSNLTSDIDRKNVSKLANIIIPRLRKIASDAGIDFGNEKILLSDKSTGKQNFSIEDAKAFYESRKALMQLLPTEITKFKGLTNALLGFVYREDGSYFKFSESDYKKLLDKDGNVITDKDVLKDFERLSMAASKNVLLDTDPNYSNYSNKSKALFKKYRQVLKKSGLKGNRVPNNHSGRIKNAKQELTPIVTEENALNSLNELTQYNELNKAIAELYISLLKDFYNNSSDKKQAAKTVMIILAANRNTVNAFRSLSKVERIIYDPNNETLYHFEHDDAMANIIGDIFEMVVSDKPIVFNSTASLIPVDIAKKRDITNNKTSRKPQALSLYAEEKANKNYSEVSLNYKNQPQIVASRAKTINQMVARKTGIESTAEISEKKADLLGKKKGRFKFFVPPSADDFMGLMYYMVSKGKQGDADLAWIKQNFIDPFSKGINDFTVYRQATMKAFREFKKQLRKGDIKLQKKNKTGFDNETAVRVYIWNKRGFDLSNDLTQNEINELVQVVKEDSALENFAKQIINLTAFGDPIKPEKNWNAGTITTDILDYLNTSSREMFLAEYLANAEETFGKFGQDGKLTGPIANKLKAAYGQNYIDALSDVLYRMKTGRRRIVGSNKLTNQFINWINNSVGTIMFFNTRSALLQQLSFINFINFSDNNPLAASAAFLNQKQFWKDYAFLMNSDFLKERRSGLKTDINADEIAKAAEENENKVKGVLSSLLKKGFLPTQIADSHAISLGGASFYRNRVNRYLKEGKSQTDAEKQAFLDFQETAEESQQSSRPDRISMQQASSLGRLILAFANTPMQYARLSKKAALDLINKRGDWKTNLSKLMYYTAIQNILFSTAQSAMFALAFTEEDDDETRDRYFRVANGSADSLLRGLGFGGAVVTTGKNMVLEAIRQAGKDRPDYEQAALKALTLSPPVDSKIRKLFSAARVFTYKNTREKMLNEGFSLDNPAFMAGGQTTSALLNIPMDRIIRKMDNLSTPVRQDVETWQAISLALGYSKWDVGLIEKNPKPKAKTTGMKSVKLKTRKL
jgi:hypothetical protein